MLKWLGDHASKVVVLLSFFALLTVISIPAVGQDVASLTGVVTDPSGAIVTDVKVTLLDTKTNAVYEATTNSAGAYVFNRLPPGPGYKITFSKTGFETLVVPDLYLGVSTTHTQNATLTIGKTTETVEVKGEASVVSLNTTDATVGNSFDMNMVAELPVLLRDSPTALLQYQPGVTTASSDDDPNQSRNGSSAGSRTDQGNVTLDGLDVNDFAGGFAFDVINDAPVDSLQEFHGEVANPLSAEGRGSGMQMNLVTKSGTNTFHGAAYEYYRTRAFEANDFFNKFVLPGEPVVPRLPLVRNQFGADLGGPIVKDKLFFFFNYQGRRDARGQSITQTVPLTSFAQGTVSYLNTSGNVGTVSGAALQALDPAGIGANTALESFVQGRYPAPNTSSVGDGLNTAGFTFDAPANTTLNDYVAKVDYNLGSKMKMFVRASMQRQNDDRVPSIQFPGDPLTFVDINHGYAFVLGHTWNISNNKLNQFVIGENRQQISFPYLYAPLGTTAYSEFDANGTGGSYLTSPYMTPSSQARVIPLPIIRDDFTYVRGTHTLQFGGTFKDIKTTSKLVSDFNYVTLGLGGTVTSLTAAQRPADLSTNPVFQNLYDSAFTFLLGRYGEVSSNYNNNRELQPLPQGTGHLRQYKYYETEVYAQDSWKARSDLTLTYGLRYQFYTVPYEIHGLEAAPDINFAQAINPRIANGLDGNSGCPGPNCGFVNPLISYSLSGKVNNAASLYHSDLRDFQPRFAFAYNPSGGWFFGDRKTVIRGGAALIDDHTMANALNFLQDQNTWILQSSAATLYTNLGTDPRFTNINSLPAGSIAPPPVVTTPYVPGANNPPGVGGLYPTVSGLIFTPFNYSIDNTLKTPYSEMVTFGIQRELPSGFQLDVNYVGRFAHRLLAQSDAMQTVDFKDPASGQLLSQAFANLTTQVRNQTPGPNGYTVTPIPFFENQVVNALAFGFPSATNFVANYGEPYVYRGDVADTLQLMNEFLYFDGIGIYPGVGLNAQFGTSLYMTNKAYSNYNGLLATLHKKVSHGLLFDLNYTWSHSIDDISAAANEAFGSNGAGGIICDAINLGVCRGNSDFDIQQNVTGDWVYDLPFGRGRAFGGGIPRWANQAFGGWTWSGLLSWRTGLAFQSVANAYPISFANNVPAIFDGDKSALEVNTHREINPASGLPTIQLFKNYAAAFGAFSGPLGLEAGSRNNLRGPHFSDFDMALSKHFPITERVKLEFRGEAYNVFNHTNFELPGTNGTADITSPSSFGVIASDYGTVAGTTGGSRVLQVALRVDF